MYCVTYHNHLMNYMYIPELCTCTATSQNDRWVVLIYLWCRRRCSPWLRFPGEVAAASCEKRSKKVDSTNTVTRRKSETTRNQGYQGGTAATA